MNYTERPSPNFDGRDGQAVDTLVLHYTGMPAARDALERLCDPNAKVSAHYVVDEDGTVYRLVDESMRAWHAGVSSWRGNSNINQRSIGIEIVNPGHEFGYRPFTLAQMEAVKLLCHDILSRHTIPARNVVAHSDVAPSRKEDPGELFGWKKLAGLGIGLWPKEFVITPSWSQAFFSILSMSVQCFMNEGFWGHNYAAIANKRNARRYEMAAGPLPTEDQLKEQLATYGYDIADLPKAIMAFQRHFFPARLTGAWDPECALRLASLLTML